MADPVPASAPAAAPFFEPMDLVMDHNFIYSLKEKEISLEKLAEFFGLPTTYFQYNTTPCVVYALEQMLKVLGETPSLYPFCSSCVDFGNSNSLLECEGHKSRMETPSACLLDYVKNMPGCKAVGSSSKVLLKKIKDDYPLVNVIDIEKDGRIVYLYNYETDYFTFGSGIDKVCG